MEDFTGTCGIDIANVNNAANNIAKATATGSTVNVGSTIATGAQVAGAAAAIVFAALEAYKMYASKDDHRLLAKILMEDCGALSKMTTNIEGCYRQYVSKAVHRSIMSPNYMLFQNRFQECFAKRPVHPCSAWGEDVFTSTGG